MIILKKWTTSHSYKWIEFKSVYNRKFPKKYLWEIFHLTNSLKVTVTLHYLTEFFSLNVVYNRVFFQARPVQKRKRNEFKMKKKKTPKTFLLSEKNRKFQLFKCFNLKVKNVHFRFIYFFIHKILGYHLLCCCWLFVLVAFSIKCKTNYSNRRIRIKKITKHFTTGDQHIF